MKFEVDIENSTLSEYFNEENGDITFTDAFKEEVIRAFLNKLRFDGEIRDFIKYEIKNGLNLKVTQYKQDCAIKIIVEDVIREELKPHRSGSFFYLKEYEQNVKVATMTVLANYVKEIKSLIETTMRFEVEKVLETLYKGNKMREFLNMDKLSAYVVKTMNEQKESEDTNDIE